MPYVKGQAGTAITPELVIFEELRAKTITTSHTIPGRLVKRDTDDSHFQLTGAGDTPLGFIGRDPRKDATVDLAAEDWARIGHGPGGVVVLSLGASQTIIKGDVLVCDANGRLKKAAGTEFVGLVVGKAEESISTGAGEYKDIAIRLGI